MPVVKWKIRLNTLRIGSLRGAWRWLIDGTLFLWSDGSLEMMMALSLNKL